MSKSAKVNPLLTPFRLKGLQIKNRILSTSHCPNYVEHGAMPGERYQRYHEEKAKGGIGMSMFGGSSNVSTDSPSIFGQLDVSTDRIIPYFQQLSERVHKYDCRTMCQITHVGRRGTDCFGPFLPSVAPSRIREPSHKSIPKELDQHDIDRIVQDYGKAALRCQQGGLDGVEILAAGHLVDQFMSPFTNLRTDKYGGSPQNRARFGLEILEAIRGFVGPDFIVGMRVCVDEKMEQFSDSGYDLYQGIEMCRYFAESGMVDFFNVNFGQVATHMELASLIPNMMAEQPLGMFMEKAGEFRNSLKVPVFHASRITDLSTARRGIEEGLLDMVGMTRAHIADPHIVNKLMEDREEDIRPCVGAGYCIDRIYMGGEALCLHSPATGREDRMKHEIDKGDQKKRVVIVGAGIAGLECARICALRGHDVSLIEAQSKPGGQLIIAAKGPRRQDLLGISLWRFQQCEKLGVDLQFNCYADADMILEMNPDIVICATGGFPSTNGLENASSVWEILNGEVELGKRVLVYDDFGSHSAASVSEFIGKAGSQVEMVTRDRVPMETMGSTNFSFHLRGLYKAGVRLTPDLSLESIEKEGDELIATLRNEYSWDLETRRVDQVIVDNGTTPITDLFDELRPKSVNDGVIDLEKMVAGEKQNLKIREDGFELYRLGDAVSSRNIHAACLEALAICQNI